MVSKKRRTAKPSANAFLAHAAKQLEYSASLPSLFLPLAQAGQFQSGPARAALATLSFSATESCSGMADDVSMGKPFPAVGDRVCTLAFCQGPTLGICSQVLTISSRRVSTALM